MPIQKLAWVVIVPLTGALALAQGSFTRFEWRDCCSWPNVIVDLESWIIF